MIGECSYGEKERERSKKTGKLITLNVCDEDFIKSKMGLQINKGRPYDTISSPRGLCIIINIKDFKGHPIYSRVGSEKEVWELKTLFTKLDYAVETYVNLEAEEILNELMKVNDKAKGKSFVTIMMSHGNDGDIFYGADLKYITIKQVRKILNNENTPKLVGCPKFIAWQACRGMRVDNPIKVHFHLGEKEAGATRNIFGQIGHFLQGKTLFTRECDIIVGFATHEDYASFRDPQEGAWFIQVLIEVIYELASERTVIELLQEVTRRLIIRKIIQVPNVSSNARKNFYLFPLKNDNVQNGPENIVARIELVEASENKTASKVVQPNEKEEVKTAFEAVHENNDGQSSEEEEEEEEAV